MSLRGRACRCGERARVIDLYGKSWSLMVIASVRVRVCVCECECVCVGGGNVNVSVREGGEGGREREFFHRKAPEKHSGLKRFQVKCLTNFRNFNLIAK